MRRIIRFERTVADSILTAAMSAYPREVILILQGKKVGDEIRLNNVLIPPLATYGRGFSILLGSMLAWDLTIMGVAHSHPSGGSQALGTRPESLLWPYHGDCRSPVPILR